MKIGIPGLGAFAVVCVVAVAYILAAAAAGETVLPAEIEVTLVATGKKNPSAKSAEVWVIDAPGLDRKAEHHGWERRDNDVLVSYVNQPSRLTWRARTSSTTPIVLFKHPYSGVVELCIGKELISLDLYSPLSGTEEIRPWEVMAKRAAGSSLLALLVFAAVLGLAWLCSQKLPRPNERELDTEFKTGIFVLISAYVAGHTLVENRLEIGLPGLSLTFFWFLAVLLVELVFMRYASRHLNARLLPGAGRIFTGQDTLLLLMFILNLYTTKLFAYDTGSLAFWILGVGAVLLLAAFLASARHPFSRQLGKTVAGAMAVALLVGALFGPAEYRIETAPHKKSVKGSGGTRPNVYFLSLDALSSKTELDRLDGLPPLALWGLLEDEQFRLRDARSAGIATLETFFRIFSLTESANASRDIFLGLNPVIDRLKSAGYRVQSIQGSAYLGIFNDYWDYYYPAGRAPFDYCWSVPKQTYFFGICYLRTDRPSDQLNRIAKRIPVAAPSRAPWFTFAHVLSPSHTPVTFHYKDRVGREDYLRGYAERLDELHRPLLALFQTIKSRDPSAIIILHGDHGPWLSRGWTEEGDRDKLFTAAQVEADRRAVTFAIYPADFCKEPLNRIKTTADILPSVFDCLGY